MMPMMSDSFMIRSSAPSILTSVPDHLPNSARSSSLIYELAGLVAAALLMVRCLFLGFGVLDPANDVKQPRRLHWIDVVDADYLRHRHNKPLISRGR
jgi:hypothetical protein